MRSAAVVVVVVLLCSGCYKPDLAPLVADQERQIAELTGKANERGTLVKMVESAKASHRERTVGWLAPATVFAAIEERGFKKAEENGPEVSLEGPTNQLGAVAGMLAGAAPRMLVTKIGVRGEVSRLKIIRAPGPAKSKRKAGKKRKAPSLELPKGGDDELRKVMEANHTRILKLMKIADNVDRLETSARAWEGALADISKARSISGALLQDVSLFAARASTSKGFDIDFDKAGKGTGLIEPDPKLEKSLLGWKGPYVVAIQPSQGTRKRITLTPR